MFLIANYCLLYAHISCVLLTLNRAARKAQGFTRCQDERYGGSKVARFAGSSPKLRRAG